MTIPLCRRCHTIIHNGNNGEDEREIIYFQEGISKKTGLPILIGKAANGKIVLIDKDVKRNLEPNKFYDCLLKRSENVAFARDIKELEIPVEKEQEIEEVNTSDRCSIVSKRFKL